MLLECHNKILLNIYGLPEGKLHFDDAIINVLFNGKPVEKLLVPNFLDDQRRETIVEKISQSRENAENSINTPSGNKTDKLNRHLDYEMFIIDKLVDLSIVPSDIQMPPSGKTFYKQFIMYSLMNQGFQLTKYEPYHKSAQWFSQWTDSWFVKHTLARYGTLHILENHQNDWQKKFSESNTPKHKDLDGTFEAMKNLRREMIETQSKARNGYKTFIRQKPEMTGYASLVALSMEYNEHLRLVRGPAVYNFIRQCEKERLEPLTECRRILAQRRESLQQTIIN